jgi:hypothetical protein
MLWRLILQEFILGQDTSKAKAILSLMTFSAVDIVPCKDEEVNHFINKHYIP